MSETCLVITPGGGSERPALAGDGPAPDGVSASSAVGVPASGMGVRGRTASRWADVERGPRARPSGPFRAHGCSWVPARGLPSSPRPCPLRVNACPGRTRGRCAPTRPLPPGPPAGAGAAAGPGRRGLTSGLPRLAGRAGRRARDLGHASRSRASMSLIISRFKGEGPLKSSSLKKRKKG